MAAKSLTRKDLREKLGKIKEWYGDAPPTAVLAQELRMGEADAVDLWAEYMNTTTRGTPRKRKFNGRKEVKVENEKTELHKLPTGFIKGSTFLAAIADIVRNAGYIGEYFTRARDGFSWLMSSLIVFILFISPQIFIIAWKKKQPIILATSAVVFLLFASFTVYITSETLATNQALIAQEATNAGADVLKAKHRLETIKNNLEEYTKTKGQLEQERGILLNEQAGLDKQSKTYATDYLAMRNRLSKNKADSDSNQKKIDEETAEQKALQNTKGLYTMTFKEDSAVEFEKKMFLVFSLAMVLVGPWLLSVALFMEGDKHETHQTNKAGKLPESRPNRDAPPSGNKRLNWFFRFREERRTEGDKVAKNK